MEPEITFGRWGPRQQTLEEYVGARGLVREASAKKVEKYPESAPSQPPAGTLALIEMRGEDFYEIEKIRLINRPWLQPWEATLPPESGKTDLSMRDYLRHCRRQMKTGVMLPMKMVLDGRTVGQMTLSGVNRGAMQSGSVGYWISQDQAGRGITTLALAMMLDFCLTDLRLNRVEVPIRPHNQPSLRVVEKLGLENEGLRRAYLHIAGEWADHIIFTAIVGRVPEGGFVAALERTCNGESNQ